MQRPFPPSVQRVVIKVGSAVLNDAKGLDTRVIDDLSAQIADLKQRGLQIVLVSSGAVAAGRAKLSLSREPKSILEKQALAAIGQGRLLDAYEKAFESHAITVAQILLTRHGLISRQRFLNAKNTLNTLLAWDILPIVNENDTVATEELQFTDNDALAVLIVNLMEADLLICLSDVDGLYDRDPREHPRAQRISKVRGVDAPVLAMAGQDPGRAGRGGMKSKLQAAATAGECGVPMLIAGGREKRILSKLFAGEDAGTLFLPAAKRRISGRKPWILFALAREGVLELDQGAVQALIQDGKSLLPVGIKKVKGDFQAGACVLCRDAGGSAVAVGLVNYGAQELQMIAGCRSGDIASRLGYPGKEEIIHRDNLVPLL